MKLHLAILFTLAFLLRPTPAHAQQMTLDELKGFCSGKDIGSVSACKFFIYGVVQGASLAAGAANDKNHFCIPAGVSTGFMVELVKERMRTDLASFPSDKSVPAVSFIAAALTNEYPCKAQAPF